MPPDKGFKTASKYGINLHWLLTGDGDMFLSDQSGPTPGEVIDDIIKRVDEDREALGRLGAVLHK